MTDLPTRTIDGTTVIHHTMQDAVQEYLEGASVVAFRLASDLKRGGRPVVHQSVQHHFVPEVRYDMQRAYRDIAAGNETNINRIPMASTGMDNSFNTIGNHRVQHELHDLSRILYGDDYKIHIDRAWFRHQRSDKTPTFAEFGFHREGHAGVLRESAPSTAIIIIASGTRYVSNISGPIEHEEPDWRRVTEDEFNPDEHTIDSYVFEVREGNQPICVLLDQNRPHGVDPRGTSTGIYFGAISAQMNQHIAAKWDTWRRKGTWKHIRVPMLDPHTWDNVKVACTLMGAPFPIYGSGKHCEMDGIPTSCRTYKNQKARCLQPMIPRWRSDGKIDQHAPGYREEVEDRGIDIHEDFWKLEDNWVNCPVQMFDEFGPEYMTKIGFTFQYQ